MSADKKILNVAKTALLVLAFIVPSGHIRAQGIKAYNYTVTTIGLHSQPLSQFSGRRILITVIPVTHTTSDTAFLDTLNTLAARYSDSLAIIGIPSYENGYTDNALSALTYYYDSLVKAPAIVTRGMYTHKTSPRQNPLFQWLTNNTMNGHFNADVGGPGELYFINDQGNLYGVFGPQQSLNDALIQQMLQTQTVSN